MSSMQMGATLMGPDISHSFSQSSELSMPERTFCMLTPAREQSIRMAICSRGISSEKNATERFAFMQAWDAMLIARDVLPMDGRAPIRINSPGCRPVSSVSS